MGCYSLISRDEERVLAKPSVDAVTSISSAATRYVASVVSRACANIADKETSGSLPSVLEKIVHQLAISNFTNEYMEVMMEREVAVTKRALAINAPRLAAPVRVLVLQSFGQVLTGMGLRRETILKAAALMDLFVASAPPRCQGTAAMPSLFVAICKLVKKQEGGGSVLQAEALCRHFETLLKATLVQTEEVGDLADFEAAHVSEADVLRALTWQVDPPTVLDFLQAMYDRLQVATHGFFSQQLTLARDMMMQHTCRLFQSINYLDMLPSRMAAGLMAIELTLCDIVPIKSLASECDGTLIHAIGSGRWGPVPSGGVSGFSKDALLVAGLAVNLPTDDLRRCAAAVALC